MPPIATGSMPPRLHPGRTDLACCCLFESRQWVQERIKSLILPPDYATPHNRFSAILEPRFTGSRLNPPAGAAISGDRRHGTTAWIRGDTFPFRLHPCEGIRPSVVSGCRQRQERHTLPVSSGSMLPGLHPGSD